MTDYVSRRTFIQTTAAATAAFALHGGVRAAGSDIIRVGVVGCGGRGTGAARDCMRSSEGVEVVALGDLAPDRLTRCRGELTKFAQTDPAFASKLKLTDERCFSGFDAIHKVLNAGVDFVILAAPPFFRPAHLAAALAAGKHVFAEKPVAVDSAGIRSVLASYKVAKDKGLGVGVGTQRRHQAEYLQAIERIQGGAIGPVMSGQVYWNQGGLWNLDRQPEWTDAEWQIRNWLYFTWLSGDHIVEQHVHNIDVANWFIGAHPVKAVGTGGRQSRTDPKYGHIYDHFAIDFEYPDGVHVLSMSRQIEGTQGRIGEHFIGAKGTVEMRNEGTAEIRGANAWTWARPEKRINPYVQEHTDLIASIRAGKPLNELLTIAESNLTAIMGREAAYTGQEVTWEQALNAELDLTPPMVGYGPLEVPPVPMPGKTRLSRKFNG